MSNTNEKSYAELHRPASSFDNRDAYLEHELEILNPKRWKINLPLRDYRFEWEDLIPAMAGTIGKVVMVGAVAAAFAVPLGLPDGFVLENVRYELLIASFFILLLSGFFLPTANLPGTHGPLIPLIPIVVAAGGHPLAFGILIAVFGFILGISKGGSLMAKLTGNGVCGGLLLYLGFIGTTGQVKQLFEWAGSFNMSHIAFIIILGTIILYALLEHWQKRWLAVPLGCLLAGVTAYILGAPFTFKTAPGLPPLSPNYWWGENTGWMLGWPTLDSFLVARLPRPSGFPKTELPRKSRTRTHEHRRHHGQLCRTPGRRFTFRRCELHLIMGHLHHPCLRGQTPDSRRRDPHRRLLHHRQHLGLSDGLGDMETRIERGTDCRRIRPAA